MIRHVQISSSDYNAMQHLFMYRPEFSASIAISGSELNSIINTHVTYETSASIISIAKYMSLSCSYIHDMGQV